MNLISLLVIFGIGLVFFVWALIHFLHVKNDKGASHASVRMTFGILFAFGLFIALLAFAFVSDFMQWSRN